MEKAVGLPAHRDDGERHQQARAGGHTHRPPRPHPPAGGSPTGCTPPPPPPPPPPAPHGNLSTVRPRPTVSHAAPRRSYFKPACHPTNVLSAASVGTQMLLLSSAAPHTPWHVSRLYLQYGVVHRATAGGFGPCLAASGVRSIPEQGAACRSGVAHREAVVRRRPVSHHGRGGAGGVRAGGGGGGQPVHEQRVLRGAAGGWRAWAPGGAPPLTAPASDLGLAPSSAASSRRSNRNRTFQHLSA